jgi:hypothetical protein
MATGSPNAVAAIQTRDAARTRRARAATAGKQRRLRGGADTSVGGAPDHAAYLNGWRNASAALAGGTPKRGRSVGAYVAEDDLGLLGRAIPLERHRETVAVSRLELNEHRATPSQLNGKTRARRPRCGWVNRVWHGVRAKCGRAEPQTDQGSTGADRGLAPDSG